MTSLKHWYKHRAEWLDLIVQSAPIEGSTGWVWYTEKESQDVSKRIKKANTTEDPTALQIWLPPNHTAKAAHEIKAVPLAHFGEATWDRWMKKMHMPTLWADPTRPEQLWIALDEASPPLFWIPAGTTTDSISRAFSPYNLIVDENVALPYTIDLPKTTRIFLGSEQTLGANFEQLANFVTQLPGTDSLPWGNRSMDDPWPSRPTGLSLMSIGYSIHEKLAPLEGSYPSQSARSRRLRSLVTLYSISNFFVLEAKYTPITEHQSILSTVKAAIPATPISLPDDMPVDVLSVFARFQGDDFEGLQKLIEHPDEQENFGFLSMASLAVIHDDGARVRQHLRHLLTHYPDKHGLVYELASMLGQRAFLYQSVTQEQSADLRNSLLDFLRPQ